MKSLQFKTVITLLALAALASCKKDISTGASSADSIQPYAAGSPKKGQTPTLVKTVQYGSGVIYYTYDAGGRLIKEKFGSDSVVYQYPDNFHVSEIHSNTSNEYYELNSKGLAVKRTDKYGTTTFTYNAKKQLTDTYIQWNGGGIEENKYTYVNGNVDSLIGYTNGSLASVQKFSYYLDKPNLLDNNVFGKTYLGVGSVNLLKSSIYTYLGVPYPESIYTYQFDPLGRVNVEQYGVPGGAQSSQIFTYY